MRGAYVFGPWTMSSDRPDFAYRSAPREDDRAEVWLHTPDDGSPPYYAGCFGGSECFNLHGASTFEQARRAMDQRIVLAGHYLFERIQAAAQHWQTVATVAREIDAQHRGGGAMADDDPVDVIARALRNFHGLVRERDRLRAVLDAEQGKKGLPGWVYDAGAHVWIYSHQYDSMWSSRVGWVPTGGKEFTVSTHDDTLPPGSQGWCIRGTSTDALDGMEKATARLRELGLIPADTPKP